MRCLPTLLVVMLLAQLAVDSCVNFAPDGMGFLVVLAIGCRLPPRLACGMTNYDVGTVSDTTARHLWLGIGRTD